MSKPTTGLLTFAYGLEYQKQAYCQALTARRNLGQPLTVVTNRVEYVPLSDIANVVIDEESYAPFEYEKNALALTPYDVTFKTDADMLFPVGSMVYHPQHLPFSSGVATDVFDTPTESTAYREVETEIGLPSVYSALFSFDRRTVEAQAFFKHIEYMLRCWYGLKAWDFASRKLPPTTDTMYSLAHLNVMGAARLDGNQFVHCKPYINIWTNEDWTSTKSFTVDNQCRMYLDGVRISTPFHYYDKRLITDAFIKRLENVCSV